VVAGLKDLVQMRAAGEITDAEFAEAKSRLLQHG
jgi:Short C-terminal domain